MTWGKPSDYLLAHKFANASEWRRHLMWLEEKGYPLIAQLRKELERREEKDKSAGDQARGRRGQADQPVPLGTEHEGANEEMGNDLLAGDP